MTEKELIQVGWRSRVTGVICDCPVWERSPHAHSDPVFVERDVTPLLEQEDL